MKRLHGLFDRRFIIEAMALEDVDIVEPEPLEGAFDRCKDALMISSRCSVLALRLLHHHMALHKLHTEEEVHTLRFNPR